VIRRRDPSAAHGITFASLLALGMLGCPPASESGPAGAVKRLRYDFAYDFIRVSISRPLVAPTGAVAPLPKTWRGRDSVMAMSHSSRADFAACYHPVATVTEPRPEGRVGFAFTIEPGGEVLAARVESSALGNATVEACVLDRIRQWRFAPPVDPKEGRAIPVDVTLPLIFRLE